MEILQLYIFIYFFFALLGLDQFLIISYCYKPIIFFSFIVIGNVRFGYGLHSQPDQIDRVPRRIYPSTDHRTPKSSVPQSQRRTARNSIRTHKTPMGPAYRLTLVDVAPTCFSGYFFVFYLCFLFVQQINYNECESCRQWHIITYLLCCQSSLPMTLKVCNANAKDVT